MTIEINTVQFEMSHGKRPRGIGYWAFALSRHPNQEDIYWYTGSYSAAKKAAVDFFTKKSTTGVVGTVYVLS